MSKDQVPKPLSLAFSGGGIRAMAFHMGLLQRLAEDGALEFVQRVSTVSGGSLLVGLLLAESGMRWPSSSDFLKRVYPALRSKLCSQSLQWGALRQFRPWRPQHAIYRANLLALALRKEWGITQSLSDVPAYPEWSINGTTAENGKRFRFKSNSLGDWDLGYVDDVKDYPLADALAVSAAFPGGFGPLKLDASQFVWRKRAWDAPVESATVVQLPYRALHLYDGGVYDNLGLEPLFDVGKLQPKHDVSIIASDAGGTLKFGFDYWAVNPLRIKRVADIMAEQSRALRVRGFMRYLQFHPSMGAYVFIDAPCSPENLIDDKSPAHFKTTLRCLPEAVFDAIARHGWETADVEFTGRKLFDT